MNSDMHTSSDSDVSCDEDASRTSMGEKTPKRPSKRLKSSSGRRSCVCIGVQCKIFRVL